MLEDPFDHDIVVVDDSLNLGHEAVGVGVGQEPAVKGGLGARRDDVVLLAGTESGDIDRIGGNGPDVWVDAAHRDEVLGIGGIKVGVEKAALLERCNHRTHLGGQPWRGRPGLYSPQRGHEFDHRIVIVGHRGMPRTSLGAQSQPAGRFFAEPETEQLGGLAHKTGKPVGTLVEHEVGVEQFGRGLEQVVDTLRTTGLFISHGHKDQVAAQCQTVAFGQQHHHELHHAHALHVQSSATPDNTVNKLAPEGVTGPVFALYRNHVDVREQTYRSQAVTTGALKPGRDRHPALPCVVKPARYTVAFEDSLQEQRSGFLVARRVGGIYADIVSEDSRGFLGNHRPID